MYTVVDIETGEFLFWDTSTENFVFSRSRSVIKEDYPTINFYIQCATEGYPEVVGSRRLEIMKVNLVTTGYGN